jgi:3-oxoadipate enol-lactonase
MPDATLDSITLYFERAGAGPPLLFIGGTGGDLRQKPGVMEGDLPKHFDVLAFDQRGLGRTDKPPGPYTMADYADDAAALIAHAGWQRCAVMGVSFGGMVAQEIAIRHPACVSRLVLACTSSGGAGGASFPLQTLADLPPEEATLRGLELADVRRDAEWRAENPEGVAKLLAFSKAREASSAAGAEAAAAHGDRGVESDAARGARLQLEARKHHNTWSRLSQIDVPTLLCGGRYDGIAPLSNMQALEERISGSQLEVFEGGHLFLVQDRKAFPRIIDFIAH